MHPLPTNSQTAMHLDWKIQTLRIHNLNNMKILATLYIKATIDCSQNCRVSYDARWTTEHAISWVELLAT